MGYKTCMMSNFERTILEVFMVESKKVPCAVE